MMSGMTAMATTKKGTIEFRVNGTLPFAFWYIPPKGTFEKDAKIIPPPETFTVRAYKNYCNAVSKKFRFKINIAFRKDPDSQGILWKLDDEPEEKMFAPNLKAIPKKGHGKKD